MLWHALLNVAGHFDRTGGALAPPLPLLTGVVLLLLQGAQRVRVVLLPSRVVVQRELLRHGHLVHRLAQPALAADSGEGRPEWGVPCWGRCTIGQGCLGRLSSWLPAVRPGQPPADLQLLLQPPMVHSARVCVVNPVSGLVQRCRVRGAQHLVLPLSRLRLGVRNRSLGVGAAGITLCIVGRGWLRRYHGAGG